MIKEWLKKIEIGKHFPKEVKNQMKCEDFPTCDSCDHWDKPENLERAGVGLCKSEHTMWSVWEYGMKDRKSENLVTLGCYGCNNHSDIIEEVE